MTRADGLCTSPGPVPVRLSRIMAVSTGRRKAACGVGRGQAGIQHAAWARDDGTALYKLLHMPVDIRSPLLQYTYICSPSLHYTTYIMYAHADSTKCSVLALGSTAHKWSDTLSTTQGIPYEGIQCGAVLQQINSPSCPIQFVHKP